MKKFKKMLCLAGLALTGLALVACSGKTEKTADKGSSTVRLLCGTPLHRVLV